MSYIKTNWQASSETTLEQLVALNLYHSLQVIALCIVRNRPEQMGLTR